MKKKFATLTIAAACVLGCAFALVGCGENDPYYGRTYTLTGSLSVNWTKKNYRDFYIGESKEISAKDVLERHWDEIDWAKTAEINNGTESDLPAHETVDGFIDAFDEFAKTAYEFYAGLKISVSDKETMTLTVTLPQTLAELYGDIYGSEITMPFAETQEQFSEIAPHDDLDFGTYINAGYHGMGIYTTEDPNRFLAVDFWVEEYVNKISLSITDYTIPSDSENSHLEYDSIISTTGNALTLIDVNGNVINTIDLLTGFTVSKN